MNANDIDKLAKECGLGSTCEVSEALKSISKQLVEEVEKDYEDWLLIESKRHLTGMKENKNGK